MPAAFLQPGSPPPPHVTPPHCPRHAAMPFCPAQDPFECRETDVGFWLKAEIRKHLPDVDCK